MDLKKKTLMSIKKMARRNDAIAFSKIDVSYA